MEKKGKKVDEPDEPEQPDDNNEDETQEEKYFEIKTPDNIFHLTLLYLNINNIKI